MTIATNTTIIDADELLILHEESYYKSCGRSLKEIEVMRARKRCKEEVAVCKQMLRRWGMFRSSNSLQIDIMREDAQLDEEEAASRRHVVLCYASALDGLGRTMDASALLESYLGMHPSSSDEEEEEAKDQQPRQRQGIGDIHNIPLTLALAKLYFKVKKNSESTELCTSIQNHIRQHLRSKSGPTDKESSSVTGVMTDDDLCCSLDDASDAYHLAGWVCIHADDHTAAYRIWKEGSNLLPTCSVLETQARKRHCWDHEATTSATDEQKPIFDANGSCRSFNAASDFDAFSVASNLLTQCPALALFDEDMQRHQLVFRTKEPILSPTECTRVLTEVELFHAQPPRNGMWSTVRHSSVKTTDVAAEDIPALRPWLRSLLADRLYPMLRCTFPKLADGSDLGNAGDRMRVHDAFIVRYDAECDMSLSLPEHSDTSIISFTVALNQRGQDFEGGGTWFESIVDQDSGDDGKMHNGAVISADQGQAVAFAGPLRHAGYPVTKGTRIILVLFLYAQDFAYGKFLHEYVNKHGECFAVGESNGSVNEDDAEQQQQDSNSKGSTTEEEAIRPSGDRPGGFVVYNQTVELVSMLNRRVASILDG